jgi:hypothetical protein
MVSGLEFLEVVMFETRFVEFTRNEEIYKNRAGNNTAEILNRTPIEYNKENYSYRNSVSKQCSNPSPQNDSTKGVIRRRQDHKLPTSHVYYVFSVHTWNILVFSPYLLYFFFFFFRHLLCISKQMTFMERYILEIDRFTLGNENWRETNIKAKLKSNFPFYKHRLL